MQILESLYLGDVRPGERSGSRSRQHVKALDELLKAEEELSAILSEEQKCSLKPSPMLSEKSAS